MEQIKIKEYFTEQVKEKGITKQIFEMKKEFEEAELDEKYDYISTMFGNLYRYIRHFSIKGDLRTYSFQCCPDIKQTNFKDDDRIFRLRFTVNSKEEGLILLLQYIYDTRNDDMSEYFWEKIYENYYNKSYNWEDEIEYKIIKNVWKKTVKEFFIPDVFWLKKEDNISSL